MRTRFRNPAMPAERTLILGGILLLAGCGPAPASCDAACRTLVVVATAEPGTLLPPVITDNVGAAVADQVFLRLAGPAPDGRTAGDAGFVPLLARRWTFPDPRTIVFHLDPAARWHDGTPVTARDVAFTFAVYRDTLVPAVSRPQLARLAAVTARDDTTAEFRFTTPYFEMFFDATQRMRILPRHLLDSVPRVRLHRHPFGQQPVGNGPYRVVRWVAGERIELAADTTFFLGRPGADRLIWRFAADPAAAVTQLLAGEADVMERISSPEDQRRVAAAPAFRLHEYDALTYTYLGLNLRDPQRAAPHPLFAARALRRALAHAVDRETLVQAVLDGHGLVPRGPISPTVWAWNDTLVQLPYDPARSRAVLDSLGWRDTDGDGIREREGRPLGFDLLYPTSSTVRARTAVILQDQVRQVGIEARLVGLEFKTWEQRMVAGRFDAVLGSRFIDPTPAGLLEFWTAAAIERGQNHEGYASPQFDVLALAATRAPTIEEARRRWQAAIAVLNEDAPGVWLFAVSAVAAVHRRVTGVTLVPGQWAATLWTWQIDPDARAGDR